jgi:hypothetical protein
MFICKCCPKKWVTEKEGFDVATLLLLILLLSFMKVRTFGMIGLWFSIPTLVYTVKVICMALDIGRVYDGWCLSTQDGLVKKTCILLFQGFFCSN